MAGVNYTYNFNNKFGLFAEAGLGPNLRIITKYERYEESTSRKTTTTIEYDPKISLAYQVGAGIELSKRITIGIDYYSLGSAKVKYEYTRKVKPDGSTDHNNDTFKRITPTMVMLRVGFKL
jgi:outer membrane protein W